MDNPNPFPLSWMVKNFLLFFILLPIVNGTMIFFYFYEFIFKKTSEESFFLNLRVALLATCFGFVMFSICFFGNAVLLTSMALIIPQKRYLALLASLDSIVAFHSLYPIFHDLDKESWILIFFVVPLSFILTYLLGKVKKNIPETR